MATLSAEQPMQSGQAFVHLIHLNEVTVHNFCRVKRLVLGRRCSHLMRIERATSSRVTLRGPCPAYIAVSASTQESLSRATRLVADLLASEVGWPFSMARNVGEEAQQFPSQDGLGQNLLTTHEMMTTLTRLGYTDAKRLVEEMRAEGLPFADEQRMEPNDLEQLHLVRPTPVDHASGVEESTGGDAGSGLSSIGASPSAWSVEESARRAEGFFANTPMEMDVHHAADCQQCRNHGIAQNQHFWLRGHTISHTIGFQCPALRSPLDELD
eukprot:Skav233500  [mRNA]  locus=scaffold2687:59964:60770:- [translate_table: standard]